MQNYTFQRLRMYFQWKILLKLINLWKSQKNGETFVIAISCSTSYLGSLQTDIYESILVEFIIIFRIIWELRISKKCLLSKQTSIIKTKERFLKNSDFQNFPIGREEQYFGIWPANTFLHVWFVHGVRSSAYLHHKCTLCAP